MNPLELVKMRLNVSGIELAFWLDINYSTIARWNKNNGKIPRKYHNRIIEFATFLRNKCNITIEELEGGKNG